MPLLRNIVQELDRELIRLHEIRKIVAGLSRTPAVVRRYTQASPTARAVVVQPPVEAREPEERPRKPRRDAGERRTRQTRKRPVEPRAVASTIPSGPVIFSPAQLTEEKARRQRLKDQQPTAQVVDSAQDLDALARSMAAHWGTPALQ